MVHSPVLLSFAQSKRRFERDCKEADRAQQYFEKMDADINVTKADVEKVSSWYFSLVLLTVSVFYIVSVLYVHTVFTS